MILNLLSNKISDNVKKGDDMYKILKCNNKNKKYVLSDGDISSLSEYGYKVIKCWGNEQLYVACKNKLSVDCLERDLCLIGVEKYE